MADIPTYNVAQLLKEPTGATRNGQVMIGLRDLVPELEEFGVQGTPASLLSGPVRMMRTTDGVLVQGELSTQVCMPCSRCLDLVTMTLGVPLEETFAPTVDVITGQSQRPEEDDQALWIDEHHLLDLSEVLRQEVLVVLPLHVLCRENCRGLCPTCGQNLNESTCDCAVEPDPRWSKLVGLLNLADNRDTPR